MRARLPRLVAALALVATVAGGAAIPAARGEDPAELRRENAAIEARARSVELELFALQTKLDGARVELATIEHRSARLAAERDVAAARLQAARRTLKAAQRALAGRVRALYEQGQTDAIEILLGARSLDEAIAGLDGLEFAAAQDADIIARAQAARGQLGVLAGRLARQGAELETLRSAAEARAAELERARARHAGFLVELVAERGLNSRRIVELERRAAEAAERSRQIAVPPAAAVTAAAPAPAPAPVPPAPAPVAPAPPASGGSEMTVVATAYALRGTTATGVPVGWGVAAVDPAVIPLGTRFTVPGYGEAVAADTGSAVRGAKIDLWFPTRSQALAWGVRTVTIVIHD